MLTGAGAGQGVTDHLTLVVVTGAPASLVAALPISAGTVPTDSLGVMRVVSWVTSLVCALGETSKGSL